MVEPKKTSKIQVFSEILPKNTNTERLLKIREEQENTRKAKEDAVSYIYSIFELQIEAVSPFYSMTNFDCYLTSAPSHQRERSHREEKKRA